MSLMDFFKKKPSSGNVAKDRLKLVLVSDRANCSPDIMEQIKNDIINVLTKYVEIDLEGLDIKISQTESDGNNGTVPALFANIPIKDMKQKGGEVKTKSNNNINNESTEEIKTESNNEQKSSSKSSNDSEKSEIKGKKHNNKINSSENKKVVLKV